MQWTPVVDFIDLFDQPVFLMADGQVPSIPVLMVSKEFDWEDILLVSAYDHVLKKML